MIAERIGPCWTGDRGRALTRISLDLCPMDLIVNWQRCSMTADWVGRFVAQEFPRAEHAFREVSIVVNELLENLVKFGADKRESLTLAVVNFGDVVRVDATNRCHAAHVGPLRAQFQRLIDGDPEALFLEQIERTATGSDTDSGLGLLALAKDHREALGLQVRSSSGGLWEVTVRAELSTREMEGKA